MLKLISWNVNARVKDAPTQVKALGKQGPHVVALQDIRTTAITMYQQAFAEIGLSHVLHTYQETPDQSIPTGVLIASCFEIERLPLHPSPTLWPEGIWSPNPEKLMLHWARRMLFVTIKSPFGNIDFYNAYITPGNHKENSDAGRKKYSWIKLDLLTGIYHALAVPANRLRILCGDFNTPQAEKPSGEIYTWGYDYDKKTDSYRLVRPDQDKIERRVLQGLAAYNLPDLYRLLHGYENCKAEKVSSWRNYRYDHIFASQGLSVQRITYLNTLHECGLSDHVPIEAVFAGGTASQHVGRKRSPSAGSEFHQV